MQCKLERKSLWIFERCSSGFNVHLTRDLTTRLEGKKTDFAWSVTWSVSINSFKFAHYYTRNLPMVIPKVFCRIGNGYKWVYKPFKRQPHKMVKHTQTICRLLPTNCLSLFGHFMGLALKWLETSPQLCLVYTLAASRYMFKDTIRNSESVGYTWK